MNYAIIAAGEGSRLAQEGFTLPKPMVTLNGQMLIDRLLSVFSANNAKSVRIIINEESALLETHLHNADSATLKIVKRSTPSSLHSFKVLLETFGDQEAICLTTTDTVFRETEFKPFIAEFLNNPDLDGLMAVTSFVDDESPLFVQVDAHDNVTAFNDANSGLTPFVSGGIYCLRPKALQVVTKAVDSGTSRMRNFQRQLLQEGLKIKAFEFSKIVDVDHIQDIKTAELFLNEESTADTLSGINQ
jgi:NDP-sugar pyrophosphorylase family protein